MSTITLAIYSRTITLLRTRVRVLKKYSYTSTITPSQLDADMNIYKSNSFTFTQHVFNFVNAALLVI